MHFWNVKALINDLKEEKTTQKQKMIYYLLASSFDSLSITMPSNKSLADNNPIIDIITVIIDVTIVIIGILFCYNANRLGDNKNFIDRMICLSIPISFRISCIYIIFRLLAIPVVYILFPQISNELFYLYFNLYRLLINNIFQIIYFVLLRFYIIKVSSETELNNYITHNT